LAEAEAAFFEAADAHGANEGSIATTGDTISSQASAEDDDGGNGGEDPSIVSV
jgi:hypothetical protein